MNWLEVFTCVSNYHVIKWRGAYRRNDRGFGCRKRSSDGWIVSCGT